MINDPRNQQVYDCFLNKDYETAIDLCSGLVEDYPDNLFFITYLGISHLLAGDQENAESVWFMILCNEDQEINQAFLIIIKDTIGQFIAIHNFTASLVIAEHFCTIFPDNSDFLLTQIELKLITQSLSIEDCINFQNQANQTKGVIAYQRLIQLLKLATQQQFFHSSLLDLIGNIIKQVDYLDLFILDLLHLIAEIGHGSCLPHWSIELAKWGLTIDPENANFLQLLSTFYNQIKDHKQSILTAQLFYEKVENLVEKVYGNYMILRGVLREGGRWEELEKVAQRQEELLLALIKEKPLLKRVQSSALLVTTFWLPYLRNHLENNRFIQNQIANLCYQGIRNHHQEFINNLPKKQITAIQQPLKIGYISQCLRTHSVGWISRWLFKHHNRNNFTIHSYFVNSQQIDDPLQSWFITHSDKSYKMGMKATEIAEKIAEDNIDILVDLDSITFDVTAEVISIKPAPIQVTWLGWDASGFPAVDYFLADPYVLPENAQNYYQETIWRLPETYVSIDGFEIDIPSWRKRHFNIPNDSIVYLSVQQGHKHFYDTMKRQLTIIKSVSNSYFLLKGLENEPSLQRGYLELAEEMGIPQERIKFLPQLPTETLHRANLTIADIVLDTFPYNGATTTLETLWMSIPLVTQVGEHFSSRNSYSMMMNVGVTEGIAFSDQEYIDWGIKLGNDAKLRQQVVTKLKKSRQTGNLWNTPKFTRNLETAYQEMIKIYSQKLTD